MSETTTDVGGKSKRGLGRGLGSLLGGPPAGGPTPAAPAAPVAPPPRPSVAASPVSPSSSPAAKTVGTTPTSPAGAPTKAAVSSPLPTVPAMETAVAVETTESANPGLAEGRVWQVDIAKLKSGAYQPRQTFEKESLEELAQSIKSNGILSPIIVRKQSQNSFEIVAGERRWRAAQLAGLHEVPVIIKNFSDREALEMAIIENVQREDLNPIEEAESYSRLAGEFQLSQQQIAERVGKDRATVANAIRLLSLPSEVRQWVGEGRVSVGHAKVLLSLPDPKKQSEFAKKVMGDRIPVRKLERLIADTLAGRLQEAPAHSTRSQLVAALGGELQKMYGTKVQIDYIGGKGQIRVQFYSDEELNNIAEKMKAGCSR